MFTKALSVFDLIGKHKKSVFETVNTFSNIPAWKIGFSFMNTVEGLYNRNYQSKTFGKRQQYSMLFKVYDYHYIQKYIPGSVPSISPNTLNIQYPVYFKNDQLPQT